MPFYALLCPHCGAPLPPESKKVVVTCGYCGVSVAWDQVRVRAADFRKALSEAEDCQPEAERFRIAGRNYRILGRLGHGESSDVFLGERAHRLRERVLIKILGASQDAERMTQEWAALQTLHAVKARGAEAYLARLPQPVANGVAMLGAASRPATVWRHLSGFGPTFDDLLRAFPQGVDPRHGVWLWRRGLEMLGFIHGAGYCHGAILPQHCVVHPRDHGVLLVGWSCFSLPGKPLPALCGARLGFYGESTVASPALDCSMLARSVIFVLGGDPLRGSLPAHVPTPFRDLLLESLDLSSNPRFTGAWDWIGTVKARAQEAFGAPSFVPLDVPSF